MGLPHELLLNHSLPFRIDIGEQFHAPPRSRTLEKVFLENMDKSSAVENK